MKKVIYFSLFVFALGFLTACSSGSPAQAAKKYAEYMESGDYDKFVDGIAFSDTATEEEVKQQKEMILALLQEKGQKSMEEKGGLKKVEIISETISEDGNTAKVILKQTYGNGDTEDANYDMTKKDGRWKMVIKK